MPSSFTKVAGVSRVYSKDKCLQCYATVLAMGELFLFSFYLHHQDIRANSLKSCYFLAYEALVQRHLRATNLSRDQISPLWAITYGAAAGYALWFSSVPPFPQAADP